MLNVLYSRALALLGVCMIVLVMPLASVSDATITGAVPKAASLHDLHCAPDPSGRWACGITVEV